ncbi:MAG: phosphatase PAP2 family protein [Prevotellaceae bacterium]|jgi:undecaprenyl-diphosphatase|nr:phosphatase PAP2 family protein [Prevotellaceae bacterium]
MNALELDNDLFFFLNGMHNSFWDSFMYVYSGKLIWIPLYAALLYTLWYNFGWRRVFFYALLAIGLTFLLTDQITVSLIRPYVGRLRPTHAVHPDGELVHIVNNYRGGLYSFPSAHAANTFGLACFVWMLFRKWWLTLFFMGWAALTCYSRVYLGVHYPGDLLVGAWVGLLSASSAYLLFRLVSRCRRAESPLNRLYIPVCVGGLTVVGIWVYAVVGLLI